MIPLQVVTAWTETAVLNIIGLALLAGVTALGFAFVYRRTTTRAVPFGSGILVGLTAVSVWLTWTAIDTGAVIETTPLLRVTTSYYLIAVFLVGTGTAAVGWYAGDSIARDVYSIERLPANTATANRLRSAEQVVEVTMPAEISDLEGYRAVDEQTKLRLAGRTLQFPRTLSVTEIERRLQQRIETDFGIDHATVTISEDGTVSSVAVGDQPAGIGPSIPSETVAVAIRGQPRPTVNAGDAVEIWNDSGEKSTLVTKGMVRSTVGDIVTAVVDETAFAHLDTDQAYRITTPPGNPSDRLEFLSVLQENLQTISALSVTANGELDGEFVSWLPVTVLLIDRDGTMLPFPAENETLQADDTVYVMGTPAAFDDLETFEQRHRSEELAVPVS